MKNWLNRILGIKRQPTTALSAESAEEVGYQKFNANDVVTRMLQNLQTEWETRPLGSKGAQDFHFHYQHGDFHVLTSDDRHQVRIHFLFFHDAPLGQLDNVRHACNEFNQHFPDFKAIYSLQPEKHLIHLHLASSMRLSVWNKALESDFADTLGLCFEAARQFRRSLDEILADDVNNLEERRALSLREQYLAHESELKLQNFNGRTTSASHQLLGDLLSITLGLEEVTYSRLTVLTDERNVLNDSDEIADFDLTALLIDVDVEIPCFVTPQATLVVEYLVADKPHTVIIHLSADAEAEGVLYQRVTIVQPEGQLGFDTSYQGRNAQKEHSQSLLISYSTLTDHEKEAEFDYLWREAQTAKENGEELADEQRFILLCESPEVAFNLYWGQRFFLSQRYYEALLHLENAHIVMRDKFASLDHDERSQFYELQYYLGQCCLHLHLPQRAYYYLDGLFNRNNLRYTQAYINSIVACHDYRALTIIDNVLNNLQRIYDDQDADEESRQRLWNFILFLRRSKARVLIENHQHDEAEKLLKQLLADDPQHERYILDQLAHVAWQRAKNATHTAATLSVTSEFPKPETKE